MINLNVPIIGALVLLLNACNTTSTHVESDLGIRGAPDWVNEGTQAIDNNAGQLIHGVGMAPPLNDLSLQKNTAENRARAEIARILQTYINSTLNDYTASSVNDKQVNTGLNVERTIQSTTQLALSGARILGHWQDKENGNLYAFAELNLEALEKLVATSEQLSEHFKQYFGERAKQRFEQLKQDTTISQ